MIPTILEWLVLLLMIPVVAQRKRPVPGLAWLILIFFKPWMGSFLYFVIGDNIVLRHRIKSYCQILKHLRVLEPEIARPVFEVPHSELPLDFGLAKIAECLSCIPPSEGNSVELLDDGRQVIDRLVEDIETAQNHVHVLFYIFKDDKVGCRVAKSLAKAAARGVVCRIAVDAFGSRSLNRALGPWMVRRGIHLHSFMPVNPFRRHLSRIDLRNHRKVAIIDGFIGYTGSQNIEVKNYDSGCPEAWHDLMVRITGPAVAQLQMVFLEDWYLATGVLLHDPAIFPPVKASGGVAVQCLPSSPIDSVAALRDLLVAAINKAQESVVITSPYFIPDEPFLLALRLASMRGVSVRLVIPRHADHPVVGAVARAYFDILLGSGIKIYFHRGFLHAKTMSIDNSAAVIGSANFDRRSFYLHSELSVLLYGPDVTKVIVDKQMRYIEQSQELDPAVWIGRSRLKVIRDQTLKLLSPVL